MKITTRSAGPSGWYDLYADGERIGQVRKKVERYNLVRPITSITWVLTMEGFERTSHQRRSDAVRQAQENLEHPDNPTQKHWWS